MNCDQVFEVLTRGPFPTGHSSDRAVESHLAECPECWRLANALRPAIELFQEAISGEEGRELPGYWGGMVDDSEPLHTASRLAQLKRRLPASLHRRFDKGRLWVASNSHGQRLRFAAALLVGIAIGAIVWSAGVPAHDDWANDQRHAALQPSEQDAPSRARSWRSTASGQVGHGAVSGGGEPRISLNLTSACLAGSAGLAHEAPFDSARSFALTVAELSRLQCCTRCHHALAESVSTRATAAVARSCEVCHR